MSMVDEHSLAIGLLSDELREQELTLLESLPALPATTLAVGEDGEDPPLRPSRPPCPLGWQAAPCLARAPAPAFHAAPQLPRAIAKHQNPGPACTSPGRACPSIVAPLS
jgi:hypothetical protein